MPSRFARASLSKPVILGLALFGATGSALLSCSGASESSGSGGATSSSSSGMGGAGGASAIVHDDFAIPVLDMGAPADAPVLFGAAGTTGGPCLYEPELGTLFPQNWLRPRFRFTAPNQENLFEIELTIPNEKTPLVIYTTQTKYTLEQTTWSLIAGIAAGGAVHVKIRSAVVSGGALTAGPFTGSEGDIEIAPVDAAGSIVYWTTSNGTVLKGFKIGDESVAPVITPAQSGTACVACHSSTPDGKYVAVTASDNASDGSPGYVHILSLDGKAAAPAFVTPSAATLLARTPQHAPELSKGHWTPGDYTMLSM